MNIIALDLGQNMAYASNIGAGKIGVEHFDGDREARACATMTWLNRTFREAKAGGSDIDVVIYETPFARGEHATRCLWGLAGIIEACGTSAGAAILDLPPASIKLWATGSGKADKADMLSAAQIMGYDGENEHEADAFCLLKYAEATCRKKEK